MCNTLQVVCAIIVQNNRVLCAQRAENMSLPLKWEFPGGKIEPGESPENCLKREIKEELNLFIEVDKRLKSNVHTYGEGRQIELIPFLARIKGGDLQVREHKQVIWKGFHDLKNLDWAEADIPIMRVFVKNHSQIE